VVVRPAVVCWRCNLSTWTVLRRRGSTGTVLGRRRSSGTGLRGRAPWSARSALRGGPAVAGLTGSRGRWCGCGVRCAGTHAGGGCTESGGDGHARDQLLEFHVHGATPTFLSLSVPR
jgi:hypothetical protein